MLLSDDGGAFQVACLRFLNRFVETSRTVEQKVFIQYELQEAGLNTLELDSLMLKVILCKKASYCKLYIFSVVKEMIFLEKKSTDGTTIMLM